MSSQAERDKTDYTPSIGGAVTWVRARVRDVLRGYSDQEYIKHLAVASGQLDEEIRNEAVRWFEEHHLQIRGQI